MPNAFAHILTHAIPDAGALAIANTSATDAVADRDACAHTIANAGAHACATDAIANTNANSEAHPDTNGSTDTDRSAYHDAAQFASM